MTSIFYTTFRNKPKNMKTLHRVCASCASRKETTVVAREEEEEVVCVHLPWVVDNIIIG